MSEQRFGTKPLSEALDPTATRQPKPARYPTNKWNQTELTKSSISGQLTVQNSQNNIDNRGLLPTNMTTGFTFQIFASVHSLSGRP